MVCRMVTDDSKIPASWCNLIYWISLHLQCVPPSTWSEPLITDTVTGDLSFVTLCVAVSVTILHSFVVPLSSGVESVKQGAIAMLSLPDAETSKSGSVTVT